VPTLEKTKEPSVYRRGSRYVYVWRDRGKQHKEFFPTLALAREAKRRRQAPGASLRKRPRVRFRDHAPQWVESYRGRTTRGFSETTRKEYRRDVETHLVPFFDGRLLEDVEPPDVKEWLGWMEERGVSASGIRKAKAALSALFADAKEDGLVRDNPASGVRYVPSHGVAVPRKIKPLTIAELQRFMAALPDEWRLFVLLLAHTGMRISELLGRRWADVDLGDSPAILIHDQVYQGERKGLKTANSRRRPPLSPAMARALHEWRQRTPYPDDDDPLFASSAGTPLNYSNVRERVWRPAIEAAGIDSSEYGAFHRLRHTFGSLAHESGAISPRQLSDWLGHADIAFTQRVYVSQMDAGLGDAAFLDELIPVDGWATDGQHPTRNQPRTALNPAGTYPQSDAENADQPQTAAAPSAAS
jgi:integrase